MYNAEIIISEHPPKEFGLDCALAFLAENNVFPN